MPGGVPGCAFASVFDPPPHETPDKRIAITNAVSPSRAENVRRRARQIRGISSDRPKNAKTQEKGFFGGSRRDGRAIWDGAVVATVTVAFEAVEPLGAREAGDTEQVACEGAPEQTNEIRELKPPVAAMLRV